MPYSLVSKDGLKIDDIPDNIDPDSEEIGARFAQIRAELARAKTPTTSVGGLAGAVTRGLAPVAAGAALGAAAGAPFAGVGAIPGALAGAGAATIATTVGDPVVSAVNSMLGTKYTLPTQALEDILTRVGVAQPKTEAERIVQTATAGAAGGGGMAAAGKAIQAAGQVGGVTSRVGASLADQPLKQAAGGLVSGAAAQQTQELGFGPGAQIAAGLAGGVVGAKVAPGTRTAGAGAAAAKTVKEAEKIGVDVLTSDVAQPQTFMGRAAQALSERIPVFGTSGRRVAQQAQRESAVKDLLTEYGSGTEDANLAKAMVDDLNATRAEFISKYNGQKRDVIDRLSARGTVDTPIANQKLDELISKFDSSGSEVDAQVANMLKDFKSGKFSAPKTLDQIENFRKKDLAAAFEGADASGMPIPQTVADVGRSALKQVYSAYNEDMGNFIKATGAPRDFLKWKVANARLANDLAELKNSSLKTVIMKGDFTPETVTNQLLSAKPSDISRLYSSLSEKGRANARTAILAQAAKKAAYSDVSGDRISPDRFNAEIKRLGASVDAFFKGPDRDRIKGFSRVIDITRRAGDFAVMTKTGQEVVPLTIGTTLGAGAAQVLSTLGTLPGAIAIGGTLAASRLYESAPVRNALIRLGRTKPGSPEEAAMLKRVVAAINNQSDKLGIDINALTSPSAPQEQNPQGQQNPPAAPAEIGTGPSQLPTELQMYESDQTQ